MLLPPKSDGTRIKLPADARQVTIIGANGSGKTRFTAFLEESLRPKALSLSGLDAIYESGEG
ncbi:MAG: hypothetical protein K2L78_06065, partial [Muribaculaceae bacterium]|nr:hypothetical protein [Muribaculaceae bacterium]